VVRKFEGKRPLKKPRRRWKYGIAMDLTEVGWKVVDYLNVAQVAGFCERGNELSGSIKCGKFLD